MRIIVEGADGSGKSTVTNYLAETYHCDIIQMTKWGSRNFGDYDDKLRLQNVISDRSFLSEMVYKQAFGLRPELSFSKFATLMQQSKEKKWKFIVLTAPLNVLQQRLIDRGNEDDDIVKNIGFIDHLYRIYAMSCDLPTFDTNNPFYMDKIRKELER